MLSDEQLGNFLNKRMQSQYKQPYMSPMIKPVTYKDLITLLYILSLVISV